MRRDKISNIAKSLDSVDKELLELIMEIDSIEYCAGLVPLDLLSFKAINLNLTISQLHKRLYILEKKNVIYLEAINDPGRLVRNQLLYSINDKRRGVLFYVGRI